MVADLLFPPLPLPVCPLLLPPLHPLLPFPFPLLLLLLMQRIVGDSEKVGYAETLGAPELTEGGVVGGEVSAIDGDAGGV